MKNPKILLVAFFTLNGWVNSYAAENAVRQGSSASFFCTVATGSPNVNVAGLPIARVGDPIICAEGAVCSDGVSQIFGTISVGSSTVRVNGIPAAVSGVSIVETCLDEPLSVSGWPFVDIAP